MSRSGARALLGTAAALTLTACSPILGPTKVDSAWVTLDRGRFTFNVRAGSFAEQSVDTLATVLDDQFTQSVRALDLRYDGRITFFLHTSGDDAGFGDDLGGGNGSGVAYPLTETVKTVCLPPLDGGRLGLLAHEMNHVILFNGLGAGGTAFMNEGLASALISERYQSRGRSFYYQWTVTNRTRIPHLVDLVDDRKWRSSDSNVAYSASASFLAYLLETYGSERLRGIYHAAASDFSRAFRDTYGLALEDAEAAWFRFCETKR